MFERIRQLYEDQGFKSLNDFSKNGLGYSSPQKLNRLKKPGAKPSIDIVLDLVNKYDTLCVRWLLTGKGNMYKDIGLNATSDHLASYGWKSNKDEKIKLLESMLADKEKIITLLEEECRNLRSKLPDAGSSRAV